MKTFETSIRVRYVETDAMGIVHHSNYLNWLELTRILWLDELGCKYSDLEKQGYFLPVVEARIRYKRPVCFDEILRITLQLQDSPRARCTLAYAIFREDVLVAEALTIHAFVNRERRLIKPPETFLRAIGVWSR